MLRGLWIGICSVTLAAGQVWLGRNESVVRLPGPQFQDSKLGAAVVEAVCSVEGASVNCWDTAGKPSPGYGKKLRAFLTSDHPAKFHYQKRTLCVLTRCNLRGCTFELLGGAQYDDLTPDSKDNSHLRAAWVSVKPDEKSVPFSIEVVRIVHTAELRMAVNQSAKLGDAKLTILGFGSNRLGPMGFQQSWLHIMARGRGIAWDSYAIDPLVNGNRIPSIDINGNPRTDPPTDFTKHPETDPQGVNTRMEPSIYHDFMFPNFQPPGGDANFRSLVDLSKVDSLRISEVEATLYLFGGIPAKPNP